MYMEKPIDLEQLFQLVRQILECKGFSVAIKDMELTDLLQSLSFAAKLYCQIPCFVVRKETKVFLRDRLCGT